MKRNSELGIFGGPPEGGGPALNIMQHFQGNFKNASQKSTTFKVDRPLPESSQQINDSELRFF